MFVRHLHTEAYERHAITSLTFYFEWFSQNQLFTALSMALFPSQLDTLPSPAAQLHFNYVRTGGGEGRRNLPAVTLRRRAVPRSKPTLRRRRAAAGAAGGAGVDKAAVVGRCPDGAGPRLGGVTVPSLLRAAGRARSHARPVPRAALRGGRMRPLRPWALLLGALLGAAAAAARSYPHVAVLDGAAAYRLLWGRRGSALAFRVEVRTRGYVGFGLSSGGGMASADIVVGGVEGGQPYLQDYHTDENRVLKKDPQQDYRLEYALENSTHTILAFSRELHTCDPNDKSITESTVRVIWAYHHKDLGEAGQNYHGSTRGTKSLRLLNPEKGEVSPASLSYFDLTNKDVPIPDKDTTYWCQMFKIPVQHEKHHVTKVEPLIQKGHENLVHHILLYQCSSNLNDSVLDYGHECYHPNMPDSFFTCETVIFAWAIGGEGFTYPPHVGLSIGTAADPQFVLMEVHYDNPTYTEGLIDNSGLRLFYTPVLRKYDAGVIEAGLWVSLFHNIPPGMPEFVSEGHCTLECLEEALGAERPSGIHVFAVLLHAHLAGRAIRMRHFRNGEEQKLLAYDDEFDFNFQEFQYLEEERTIMPGDNLITECHYSTMDRIRMTWGGLSTRNEMCLSYLLYYPRINLTRCASIPDIMEQLQFIGVKEIYRPVRTWPFIIKSPKQYKNLSFMDAMNKFKWSKSEGLSYNELVLKLPMNVRCSKTDNAEWSFQGMTAFPPEIERPYKTEPVICSSSSCLPCSLSFTLLFVVHVTSTTIGNFGPFVQ